MSARRGTLDRGLREERRGRRRWRWAADLWDGRLLPRLRLREIMLHLLLLVVKRA